MLNAKAIRFFLVGLIAAALTSACGSDDTTSANQAAQNGDNMVSATGDGSAVCPTGTDAMGELCALKGTILDNVTLTATKTYLLNGPVFIGDGKTEVVLTIEPGVTILGEKNPSSPGALIISQRAKIEAVGTKDAPIVFTSDQLEGKKARGDWGGIIINGRAPINCPDKKGKAYCENEGEGDTGTYGGDQPEDNSGTLKYVRVEYGGIQFSEDNELNGIAFQGVGSKTVVDYIQVHMNADDGVEFFGGTVNVKHVVLTGTADDSLDWTYGWTGKAQFVLAKLAADAGDQGIEADNNSNVNNAEPRANPTLANMTFIGHKDADIGLLLREGTSASIYNSVFTGFGDACLTLDQEETFAHSCGMDPTGIQIVNTVLNCDTPFEVIDPTEAMFTPECSAEDIFKRDASNQTADPKFDNYTPRSDSPLLNAPSAFVDDGFFDKAEFIGAVGNDDWTAGWTVGL